MRVYGSPDDYQARVSRWLRRARPGLAEGRSNAASPVRLGKGGGQGTKLTQSGAGLPGGNGLPGAEGMSRGYKMFARPLSADNALNIRVSFFYSRFQTSVIQPWPGIGNDGYVQQPTTSLQPAPLTDSAALNRSTNFRYGSGFGARLRIIDDPISSTADAQLFQVGQGNGRGGFYFFMRFEAHDLISSGRTWFVGVTVAGLDATNPGGPWGQDPPNFVQPSSNVNLIGVGQDSGDSTPQFMHNDGSGTATKVSTGMSALVRSRIYDMSVFCNPQTTDAVISFESYVGGVSSALSSYTATSDLPGVLMTGMMYNAGSNSDTDQMRLGLLNLYAEIQPRAL